MHCLKCGYPILRSAATARNRTLLSAFRSRTGRCQPSNTRYIFGPSVWLRNLIKPPPGYGVAYVDWSQQEHGIAAVLSGDTAMQAAYCRAIPISNLPSRLAPFRPTQPNTRTVRSASCSSNVRWQWRMAWKPKGWRGRIGQPVIVGRDLLRAHRETYRQFWRWSDAAVDHAVLTGSIATTFGWPLHVGPNFNPRSLRNFPCQANGAEMLRLAACFATEQGIEVCALDP